VKEAKLTYFQHQAQRAPKRSYEVGFCGDENRGNFEKGLPILRYRCNGLEEARDLAVLRDIKLTSKVLDHIVWGLELVKVILIFIREPLAESFNVLQEELLQAIRAQSVTPCQLQRGRFLACDLRGLI
jgi:hypothetical protein